jgi:CubicO group peptidase (beta-lactamase class C family)
MLPSLALAASLVLAEEKPDPGPAPSAEEQQVSADLSKRGILVQPLAAGLNWKYVSLRGSDKAAEVLPLLGKLPSTVDLDLSGLKATSGEFSVISSLKNLQKLNLSGSSVDDSTLSKLKGLEKLESLNLFNTAVSDAGISALAGMKSLKRIYLFETNATEVGAEALRKSIPGIKIETGWKAPAAVAVVPPQPAPLPPPPVASKPVAPKPQPVLAAANPAEVGMDEAKLAAIRPAMETMLKEKRAAGIVTLVVKDGRIVHHDAVGYANLESGRLMTTDAIFWIASMTKNITATAVMILVDEGKLSLDEPASKWVPELANSKVAGGHPLARPVTLRDLLSHTAGVTDPDRKPTDGNVPLEQYTKDIVKEPFDFQPGEKFEYSFGTTIAGRCVEVASGKPFGVFIQERILGPLRMEDTTFSPDAAQRARIARTYKLAGEKLVPAHNAFLTSEPDVKREAEPSGGLFSTAKDMARFYEMVRNGGEFDGKRIVSANSVAEMTKSHTVAGRPIQYGLGWFTNGGEKKVTAAFGANSFGHGGAFATHGWVDPEKKMTVVFMVQNVLVPKSSEPRDKFCELAVGAVK